jgi:hypothetical protein
VKTAHLLEEVHEDYSKEIRDVAEKLNILGRNVARGPILGIKYLALLLTEAFVSYHIMQLCKHPMTQFFHTSPNCFHPQT